MAQVSGKIPAWKRRERSNVSMQNHNKSQVKEEPRRDGKRMATLLATPMAKI